MRKKDNTELKKGGDSSVRSGRVKDFIAKIVCLAVAFFLWFYVMSTDVVSLERDFTVPVEFENETALLEKTGWSVLSGKDSNVSVTVKGKRNVVSRLTDSDIYAYVDVSGVENAGRQFLDIKISAPGECEIVNTSVSSISAYIDKRVTKNVPVKVVYVDYVISSDYQLDDPVTNVGEVSIVGPESELSRVAAAQADLSLGNVTKTVNTTSALRLVDENGNGVISNYITMMTKSVNVTVKLYAVKEVPLTVNYKYGYFNENNVKITLNPSSVTLRGEPSVLEGIEKIELITLDEKKYPTNSTQSVSINVPEGVSLMNAENSAMITVEHINTGTKQIAVSNIVLMNSGGLDCELQTKSLNVTLRGPYNLLSQITEDNLSVTVDMKNYSSGTGITVVPAGISISSEFQGSVYELENYSVTVNIK